jgi:hypothetical protein
MSTLKLKLRLIHPPITDKSMTIAQSNDIRAYPAPEIVAYMEQQADLFEAVKPQLIEQFLGQYVWCENAQVLDSDIDREALVLRIYRDGVPRPLFIRKVMTAEPKLMVRSAPNLK